jgi:biopolymer transport protein ExbD
MKLEMTLPERPGLLHAVPLLNIFALLQLFFLLGPALVLQSGVTVELPPSKFQMERYQNSIVLTLGPGEPAARIHFGRDAVTLEQLSDRLTNLWETGAHAKTVVLLQTDKGTPVGIEREVMELVLDKGFRLAVVGKNKVDASIPSQKPAEK